MSEKEKWRTVAFAVADLQKSVRDLQAQMERAFIEIERLTQESKGVRST